MIVKPKHSHPDFPDLTPDQPYFVIGIEANDYRLLNDHGKPYLYPPDLFEVIDPREPAVWITEYGQDGERYSYPAELKETGFFEDYFDGKDQALATFSPRHEQPPLRRRLNPSHGARRGIHVGWVLDPRVDSPRAGNEFGLLVRAACRSG